MGGMDVSKGKQKNRKENLELKMKEKTSYFRWTLYMSRALADFLEMSTT